jgi:hypothetical protein
MKPTWQVIDPLCTFLFSILVLSYTVPLINRIANVLLEGKPPHVSPLHMRYCCVSGANNISLVCVCVCLYLCWNYILALSILSSNLCAISPSMLYVQYVHFILHSTLNHSIIRSTGTSSRAGCRPLTECRMSMTCTFGASHRTHVP